ncbi:MAG TPA: DMT family transporter [Paracoccaceae bacterium]
MDLWIAVTLAAAAVQTLRFVLQKRLKGLGFSTGGATFSRFVFAAPLALGGLAGLLLFGGHELAAPPPAFWGFVLAGGIGQIIATFCTVALFSERSFAVGIAFTKSETVQAAGFSALVLAEPVSVPGLAAILVGMAGVLVLSRPPGGWGGGLLNRAVVLGLLAGAFFGVSAIGYRGATLEVASGSALFRAVVALAAVTTFQTIAMALWLGWREPGQVARVAAAWRATALVGLTGVLGSLGWFVAFALMNAAYVRSLGQVELIFSLAVSVLFFRERVSLREIAGIALLALGIIGIVAVA